MNSENRRVKKSAAILRDAIGENTQDVNLLNEVREKPERMIDEICYDYNHCNPRMYRRNARRDYLNPARCRRRTAKNIRKAVKQQLQYVRRDFGYVEALLSDGVELSKNSSHGSWC